MTGLHRYNSQRDNITSPEHSNRNGEKPRLVTTAASPHDVRSLRMDSEKSKLFLERQSAANTSAPCLSTFQPPVPVPESPSRSPRCFERKTIKETIKKPIVVPFKLTKGRKPNEWKTTSLATSSTEQNHDRKITRNLDGDILAADQAYVDMILETDEGGAQSSSDSWSQNITLESFTDKVQALHDSVVFAFVHTHTIKYQGEPIWTLITESNCNKEGTWGSSSSCFFKRHSGILRVQLLHKGRKALGGGWNSRETREYRIVDMIRASGKARANEMFGA